jgi:hypothetical protein
VALEGIKGDTGTGSEQKSSQMQDYIAVIIFQVERVPIKNTMVGTGKLFPYGII